MSDGFGAIRARVARRREAAPGPGAVSRLLRGRARPRRRPRAGWSLVPAIAERRDLDRDELAEAVAELLLNRWGVVFRDLAVRDSLALPVARRCSGRCAGSRTAAWCGAAAS